MLSLWDMICAVVLMGVFTLCTTIVIGKIKGDL